MRQPRDKRNFPEPRVPARTKHIDIQFHFIRRHVESKSIELVYCLTHEMTGDVLTKPLARPQFPKHVTGLGLTLPAAPKELQVSSRNMMVLNRLGADGRNRADYRCGGELYITGNHSEHEITPHTPFSPYRKILSLYISYHVGR